MSEEITPKKVIDDGGFVYPKIAISDLDGKTVFTMIEQGITRRDWLAGLAMQGILASDSHRGLDELIDSSYLIADAMIAEGKKTG